MKHSYSRNQRQALVDNWFEYESHYWESVYERLDPTATVIRERTRRSLQWVKELRLQPGTTILDAGCGAGAVAIALARCGYHHVYGVDHVSAMLDLAHKAAEHAHVKDLITLSLGDICSLTQFPDNYFGLVISLGVIGWLESPQRAITEMHRVLRPGGYLILSVGNAWCLQDVLDPPHNPLLLPIRSRFEPWARRRGWLAPRSGPERPLMRRRRSEIDQMFTAAGLRKIKSSTIGFGPFRFFKANVFPDAISLRLQRTLQSWADRRLPFLRSAGAIYLVLSYNAD